MTKLIKSHFKLIKNFQEDLRGTFLLKMKRRERTLNLLAWRFILNKVKPVRLDDLLLPRLRRRTLNSFYTIQTRKLRFFYGFYRGYRSVFFKRLHAGIKHYRFNRPNRAASLLELRLDMILVRLRLFSNIQKSRRYIKTFGVLIGGKLVYDCTRILKMNEILSVRSDHKLFFKYKIFMFLNPTRDLISFQIKNPKLVSFIKQNKAIDLESSLLTHYVRALHTNKATVLNNRAIFFNSYFPRYLEVNFRTFEFMCCNEVDPSNDIRFPFRTKLGEVKRLVESIF